MSLRLNDLQEIAQRTAGCSGADLEALCREAALSALQESFRSNSAQAKGRKIVSHKHFLSALTAAQLALSGL